MAFVFPLDDAYITLHNARALLTGHDPAYGVPALVGATSAVHLALVASLGRLMELPLASLAVNVLAAVAYALGLARLALLVQPSRWVAAGLVGLGLLAANAPYHLLNGLETGLAMAAVTWALVLAASGSQTVLPLLCGVLPFIRPELAALSLGILAWRASKARYEPAYIIQDLGLAALAAAPWTLWLWLHTGHILPLTSSAKEAFFAEQGYPLALKLRLVFGAIVQSNLGVLFVFSIFVRRSSLAIPALFFLAVVLAAFAIKFPLGLVHNFHRYIYPLLPIALLGLAVGARDSRPIRWGVGLLCLFYVAIGFGAWPNVVGGRHFTTEQLDSVAQWSREHLPSDARVLVHDAGYFAWATPFSLVDVVGLKTPASIEDHRRWTQPSLGRDRFEAVHAIALRNHVTHAVILQAEFWSSLAEDLRRHGWGLKPLREPSGVGYAVYELTPPAD
jgi:hypothetical protein